MNPHKALLVLQEEHGISKWVAYELEADDPEGDMLLESLDEYAVLEAETWDDYAAACEAAIARNR